MYYLYIVIGSMRFYVREGDATPDSFSLTLNKNHARKFKGGGSFSESSLANTYFHREYAEPQYIVKVGEYYLAKSGGLSWMAACAHRMPKSEALNELATLAEQGYSCLSIKEVK